jgi:hypothetical protein
MANYKPASNGLTFKSTGAGTEADPTIPSVNAVGGGPSGATIVVGNVASGATDSGNPVKVGGVYNSTEPTLTTGQRGDLQLDNRSNLIVDQMTANPVDDGVYGAQVKSVSIAVTTSGANYVANDCVGGIVSVLASNYATGRRLTLRSVQINTKLTGANVTTAVGFNLYFFKATPSGGTYTDNAGLAWGTGDAANKVGQLKSVAADYIADGTTQEASACYQNLNMKMPVSATTLFMLIVVQGAATITNGTLTINLEFDQE